MRKILTTLAMTLLCTTMALAQKEAGMSYFLPKTAVQIALRIEKTTFTPGTLANYSDIYFKTPAATQPSVSYRIVGIDFCPSAVPDSARRYDIVIDKKHSILSVDCDKNGVLMAINAKGVKAEGVKPFVPAPQAAPLNPQDYMSQDILSSGNYPTMARLVAQEIYDIRDSRNSLSRGEADYMPKDGEQLKLMLAQLALQEKALMQVFTGTTVKDTVQQVLTFVPEKGQKKAIAFRFSSHFGLTSNADLSGTPYYAEVDDEHIMAEMPETTDVKKQKDDMTLGVCLPGKIKIRLVADGRTVAQYSTFAAQYGQVELLSGALFGKKLTSHIVTDPCTGAIVTLKTEPLE